MGKDVIIACDFPSADETMAFLDKFGDRRPFVKIGMELYYAEGPAMVRTLKERGHKIFLDLKLHDIPNTVKKAMNVLMKLDVDMCNVHAGGTIKMMEAGLEGLTREDGSRPLLIAVTQLTSTTQERMKEDLLINEDIEKVVSHYALNTKKAGLDGVVCSPLESPAHPLRRRIPHSYTRSQIRRRQQGRSGKSDNTGSGKRAGIRLHRSWKKHYFCG